MFTEINNLNKAKLYLKEKYDSKSKNEFYDLKYEHSLDCLSILKSYGLFNYYKFGQAVLLHDVGRFFENNSKDFDHALFGYEILLKEYTKDPLILLPIKYHEEDIKWEKLLNKDLSFKDLSKNKQKQIIKGCKIVRDIDIISNMQSISSKNTEESEITSINNGIIDNLYNNLISDKDDINNIYDEISYILCGLNLIVFEKSFSYIRRNKIINKLKDKQLMLVQNNKDLYDKTIEMHDFIKTNYKL